MLTLGHLTLLLCKYLHSLRYRESAVFVLLNLLFINEQKSARCTFGKSRKNMFLSNNPKLVNLDITMGKNFCFGYVFLTNSKDGLISECNGLD
jgi:hypothetical protein